MLRCIAIDDEPLALELLEDNISKIPFLQLVATCQNPLQAMEVVQREQPDLIFLDIQMPGLTGLQFLQSLLQRPMAILITAYEKYALDSYNLDVIDYLVKPVSFERFMKACNKAYELYQLKTASKDLSKENRPDYIFVNVEYSLVKIMLADIMWIEGLKDYIRIYLHHSNKPIVTRMNMKTMEDELPPDKFIRIHKSYIIAVRYISSIRKNSVFINETELPLGESYKDSLHHITGNKKG